MKTTYEDLLLNSQAFYLIKKKLENSKVKYVYKIVQKELIYFENYIMSRIY